MRTREAEIAARMLVASEVARWDDVAYLLSQNATLREALEALVAVVDDTSLVCEACGAFSETSDIEPLAPALKLARAALASGGQE